MVRCDVLRSETGGAFDHRPVVDGRRVLDPNALAKGWIIEQAALHLQVAGVRSYFVNAGGDVIVGAPPPGRESWRVGLTHPNDPALCSRSLDLVHAAVATSGRYERGDHIRSVPAGNGPDDELTGVTVVGPELATADALATAVLAGGEPRPTWWPRRAALRDHHRLGLRTDAPDRRSRRGGPPRPAGPGSAGRRPTATSGFGGATRSHDIVTV